MNKRKKDTLATPGWETGVSKGSWDIKSTLNFQIINRSGAPAAEMLGRFFPWWFSLYVS